MLLADAEGIHGPRVSCHQPAGEETLHLDLVSPDYAAETARLTPLGTTAINEIGKGTVHWTTSANMEGNEFDLVAGGFYLIAG